MLKNNIEEDQSPQTKRFSNELSVSLYKRKHDRVVEKNEERAGELSSPLLLINFAYSRFYTIIKAFLVHQQLMLLMYSYSTNYYP